MKTVILLGTSRNEGDTKKVAQQLVGRTNWDLINLNEYEFSYYDYDHENKDDDYLSLMRKVIDAYDTLIFATPVYWYSMSGIMKVFFDRITDLLTIEKNLGRKLRGKRMAVLSCSMGSNLGDQFWLPFIESADYLGMEYLGGVHTYPGEDNDLRLEEFIRKIDKKSALLDS